MVKYKYIYHSKGRGHLQMGGRPRIDKKVIGEIVEQDPLEFRKNHSSDSARQVFTSTESIEFEVWYDNHYFQREMHGDNNGKRDGIEQEIVQNLIVNAAKHLLYYSIKVRAFEFVSFVEGFRKTRTTISQIIKDELNLNIVVNYHYLALNKYEVTLVTAMRKNGFVPKDGEFQLEMQVDGSSILFKSERGRIQKIGEYFAEEF